MHPTIAIKFLTVEQIGLEKSQHAVKATWAIMMSLG